MSSKISVNDLSEQAEDRRSCARELLDRRDIFKAQLAELKKKQAPDSEVENLRNDINSYTRKISDLLQQATELDAQDIIVTITDLSDAEEKIKASTKKVNEAVKKLNNIKNTLVIVQHFLDLGTAIVGALASTNPVAQIAAIIKAIDTFTQQQESRDFLVNGNVGDQQREIAPVVDIITSKNLPSLQLGDGASNQAQEAVFLLQKLLARLGRLEKNSVNGEFLDKTEEAVKNYQKDKGIEQDGKVNKNTWNKLGDDIISMAAINPVLNPGNLRIITSDPDCPGS